MVHVLLSLLIDTRLISLISVFSELQKNKSEATLTEAYVHQALVVGLKQLFGEVSYSVICLFVCLFILLLSKVHLDLLKDSNT